jgi:hypothetical protein
MDAKVAMSSSRNLAQQALAELFNTLKPQQTHWYSILSPRSEGPFIIDSFSPMFHLSSINLICAKTVQD